MVLLGSIIILIGSIFSLASAVGLLRLKDVYLKMHAAAKSSTLAAGLVLIGVGLQTRNVTSMLEIVLLIIFIAITNPIGTHLIAKIVHSRQKR